MTTLHVRSSISAMPPYVAGKAPAAIPGVARYKLSSNENPYPPLPGVVEAVDRATRDSNRYPDMGNAELYAALADSLGVAGANLAVATGSTAIIYDLISSVCEPGDNVVYPWPSFEAYPIAVLAGNARSEQVPLTSGGHHDLAAMASRIDDRTRAVILCTPNNPTGASLTHTEVLDFLDSVPEHVLVILDEAYAEFVRMDDPLDGMAIAKCRTNVAVARTFSKAYGLAGLRVGYACAPAEIAAALRAVAIPFGVSLPAQAAAVASLQLRTELLARVEDLVVERRRVVRGLTEIGWDVGDPQGNFVWLTFPDAEDAASFVAEAGEIGLSVRPLAGTGVRVSIGETEANTRLLELAARTRHSETAPPKTTPAATQTMLATPPTLTTPKE
ncbi:histidinol-phosphate transaminase [Gordonia rubripertincta]|uniref:Histidinol-phosphate aminotransferase n=1 Tax=Gordonia rubripertincta TaxID=36822 RepID=A0AAW4G1W6_GORRU|nr:histidinol-phosphate transaminase [Gordonia rubripertincta]MBM7277461.1 histidinol-phosphate transaminase [Gordonia rubripertincta]